MPQPVDAHPPSERLRAFTQGRVEDAELTAIAAHLETCDGCCALLDTLSTADALVSSLQSAAGGDEPPELARDRRRAVRALLGESADTPLLPGDHPAHGAAGVPHMIQGYRVAQEVGRGGMGVVYRAEHLALKRPAALKLILAGRFASAAQVARFRREAELAARLRHPNIVDVYEVGEHDGQPFLALEWVDGGTLAQRLTGTPLPPRAAATLMETLARAVQHAHALGVVHRDLKPGNILLQTTEHTENTEKGQKDTVSLSVSSVCSVVSCVPKVADFGLARPLEEDYNLTQTGTAAGTPSYMAPEQAAGADRAGAPADVYALGAILYELLTGRPPFQGGTPLDTLDLVRHAEPVSPRQLVPRLPRDMETICLKCLQKEPARRYASALALAEDLGRFQKGEPIVARPVGALGRAWKWARRRPSLALTAAALLGGSAVSTYFGIEAGRRADDARGAESRALTLADERQQARRESDRHAANLLFREGTAQCESGAVADGLYTLLDAWKVAPEEDTDFRRAVRMSLAAWRWHLPRLRGVVPNPGEGESWPSALEDGARFAICSGRGVQFWDARDVSPLGPPSRAREGERIEACYPDGSFLCLAGGRHYFRKPDGAPADDVPLPAWANALDDFVIARRGPGASGWLFQGPKPDEPYQRIWRLEQEKKEPVQVPSGGGLSYRVARDRAGRDVLVVFRHYPTGDPAEELELWDLDTFNKRSGFEPSPGGDDPAASWDGRTLLTVSTLRGSHRIWPGGHDGSVRWWDPKTGRPLRPPWQPRRVAWFTELGGDHATLASWCRDSRLRLYDLGTGLQRGGDIRIKLGTDAGWTLPFVLSSDGGTLLAGDRHREVHVWDVRHLRPQASAASSSQLRQSRPRPADLVGRAAFSPDGTAALVCPRPEWHLATAVDAATNLPRGRPLRQVHAFNPVFSPDGRLAVTLSQNHQFGGEPIARVWHVATGVPHEEPLLNPKYLHCATFSSDGRVLALGGPGGAHLWDVAARKVLWPLPEKSAACCLRFSADGTRLVVGYRSGWAGVGAGLRLWDAQTGEAAGDFVPTQGDVTHLAFADGGQTVHALVSGSKLWSVDAATGQPRRSPLTLPGSGPAVFAPDGARAATADLIGTARQWDTHTGAQVGGAMPHPARVVSLHYAPGGDLLASVCEDESVRLWDERTGLPLGPPLVHRSAVLAAEFSADGRSLRTLSASGGVHSWPVPEPVLDDVDRFALWLETFGGMRRQGDEVTLLSGELWRQAAAEFASRWPEPDPALAIPEDAAAWHEARAVEAEEDGNTAAALLHLGRLSELRPVAWAYHARRGRALSEAADLGQAAEAYKKAEGLAPAEVRNWYRHRIALLGGKRQHDATVRWYEGRLRSTGATGIGSQN
jgi:WD40 repeat protein